MRQTIIDFLMEEFNYSYETAITWINASNGNFGGSTPEELINANRGDKVLHFLRAVKQGY